jgi:hypothetical protein
MTLQTEGLMHNQEDIRSCSSKPQTIQTVKRSFFLGPLPSQPFFYREQIKYKINIIRDLGRQVVRLCTDDLFSVFLPARPVSRGEQWLTESVRYLGSRSNSAVNAPVRPTNAFSSLPCGTATTKRSARRLEGLTAGPADPGDPNQNDHLTNQHQNGSQKTDRLHQIAFGVVGRPASRLGAKGARLGVKPIQRSRFYA